MFGKYFRKHSVVNMKQTGLCGYVHDFSVDYYRFDVNNILDIHKYFMNETDIK